MIANNNIQPSGGSALDRSVANADFSKAELLAFMAAKPENLISFAINRNPTAVYGFIRKNFGNAYPLLKDGAEATFPQMDSMNSFLIRQYYNYAEAKRVHYLANIIRSLPSKAELQNWTTPID